MDGFSTIPRPWENVLSFGRYQCDKQNKQTTLFNKQILGHIFLPIQKFQFEGTLYFCFQTLPFKAKSITQLNQVDCAKL
jgi:hypothetical protein